jgi:adenine-specific DNA-methyltransferase
MEEKITTQDLKITTPDLIKERLDKLKELLPELFSADGNLNIQNLYDLANKYSSAKKEKYEFNWSGKLECQKLALEPTKSCLLPNLKKSSNFDKTQNIIIEGDNLEVLKTLYQPYFEKIKCIYIDPPYNTGNDFIYDDKRQEGKKAYWQRNGVIHEGVKLETNPESTGKKHSLWCSFIYPRLMLARNLLSKDGVIFVSIDDNEVHNLRKMMDEIFGEENFVSQLIWRGGRRNMAQHVSNSHEYILFYTKDLDFINSNNINFKAKKDGLDEIYLQHSKLKKEYKNNYKLMTEELQKWYKNLPENHPSKDISHYSQIDEKGVYFPSDISRGGGGGPMWDLINPVTKNVVKTPSRGWAFAKFEDLQKAVLENAVHFNGDGVPCGKSYLQEKEYGAIDSVFYKDRRAASKEFRSLIGDNLFDFPKDISIIQKLITISTSQSSQILDFFAGSGTTAHATLKLNAEEKIKYAKENHPKLEKGEISKEEYLQGLNETGSRKFILTQLPEYTDEKSEAFKAGYKTISAICIERVKRVGQKIIEEIKSEKNLSEQSKEQIINSLDIGFKTYELKDTSIDKAYYEVENAEILEEYLKNSQELKLFDDEKTNLLYEIAIKNGFDLSVNFTKIESIKDNEVYQVNANNRESALICVDQEIKLDSINQIAIETSKDAREWQFFCFDNALSITVKTNLKNKVSAVVI